MSSSITTVVLSTKLLEERAIPMDPCENASQPDEIPDVLANADEQDEVGEADEEDADDLVDGEDEESDGEDLDGDWDDTVVDEEGEEDDAEDE